MFKMKVRAGELVNVSLTEGGEDVLRQVVIMMFGKDMVKKGLKQLKSYEYAKSALPVFWMCLKLWSKMASSDEVSEEYTRNAEELLVIAKGDKHSLKSDASEVDDAEMFAMDDRLAAAFKAMAPRKSEKKMAAQQASAFRLRLADLLLFAISSQETPPSIKIHMIIPLLKLAKLQLKEDAEGLNSRKTISLLNILSRLKKIEVSDDEVISLLDKLIVEGSGISNPTFISTVAALCSFIFSLGISPEGNCSEAVLSAFVGLFERFMTQEDGLIGCELAIAAVFKHPEHFVPKASVFVKAGFNEEYRVFRRTEALLCLAAMMNKRVLQKAPVEKSVIKKIAKASSEYIVA
ncbi:hypothetical protein GCK32_010431, partial [Trichostrongylus colubriformis]